jgi:hypothetical protein
MPDAVRAKEEAGGVLVRLYPLESYPLRHSHSQVHSEAAATAVPASKLAVVLSRGSHGGRRD